MISLHCWVFPDTKFEKKDTLLWTLPDGRNGDNLEKPAGVVISLPCLTDICLSILSLICCNIINICRDVSVLALSASIWSMLDPLWTRCSEAGLGQTHPWSGPVPILRFTGQYWSLIIMMPLFIKVVKGANYLTLHSILKAHCPEPEHPPSGDHIVDHTEGATLPPDHQTMFYGKNMNIWYQCQ